MYSLSRYRLVLERERKIHCYAPYAAICSAILQPRDPRPTARKYVGGSCWDDVDRIFSILSLPLVSLGIDELGDRVVLRKAAARSTE